MIKDYNKLIEYLFTTDLVCKIKFYPYNNWEDNLIKYEDGTPFKHIHLN